MNSHKVSNKYKEERRQSIRSVGQVHTVLGVGQCELRAGGDLNRVGLFEG